MISALRKIWAFAGKESKNLNKSLLSRFIYAVFHMLQIVAIYAVIEALVKGGSDFYIVGISLTLLIVSIIGRIVFSFHPQLQQIHAGYFMVANKRLAIGDKLKRVPMGYFNENNLNEITGVATTVLEDVENTAPTVIVSIFGGLLNSLVFAISVLLFEWRIGVVVVVGMVIYLIITSCMERKSESLAERRQASQSRLVSSVLTWVQGMSVIKSFNLTGKGDKKLRESIEYSRHSNQAMEKLFTPYYMAQGFVLHIFSVGMVLLAIFLYINGSMDLVTTLMAVVVSFLVFAQIESAANGMAMLRIVCSSIDQANKTDDISEMDENGRDIVTEENDILFENVSFSYGEKKVLNNISAAFPDKRTTAIVGYSGSGKTTLCHLIARFWDVDNGSIKIGGEDVKNYTLESLTDKISLVFQKVYLFSDTIENNIKFGKPEATHEEVIKAAEKACCHDFVSSLPDGYNTVVGEAGATLSGGEKQRISIARAILKDAPIIILDEATANVDPENEDRLQKAIEELTKNKTIVMIAHRLKTVRSADQIIVLDKGSIVQIGTHEDLVHEQGIYADFVQRRVDAASWKIS